MLTAPQTSTHTSMTQSVVLAGWSLCLIHVLLCHMLCNLSCLHDLTCILYDNSRHSPNNMAPANSAVVCQTSLWVTQTMSLFPKTLINEWKQSVDCLVVCAICFSKIILWYICIYRIGPIYIYKADFQTVCGTSFASHDTTIMGHGTTIIT